MEASTRTATSPSPARAPRRALAALDGLRRRIRTIALWDGAAWLAAVVLLGAFVSFGLDYLLQLPWGVRAFFAVAGLGAAAVLAVRALVLPLSTRISDDDLALLVEESHPGLRQALVTAVQLSRPRNPGALYVSSRMLETVIDDVESQAGTIAPERVLRLGRMWRHLAVLVVFVLAGTVGWGARPDLAGIWWRRNVFLSGERWPKGTLLELNPGTQLAVAIGDDLPIAVRVLRGAPRAVSIEWQLEGGGSRASAMDLRERASRDIWLERVGESSARVAAAVAEQGFLSPEAREAIEAGGGELARGLPPARAEELAQGLEDAGATIRTESFDLFLHEFRNVSEPFRFWVEGGDDRIGPFAVTVRLRPRIDMQSIELAYTLPAYTGLGGEEQVQRHGNLKVPAGTRVRFRMATNTEVAAAFFILRQGLDRDESKEERRGVWPDPGAVSLALEEGRRFSGDFVVESSGHYYFQFEDPGGFRSVEPERFRVQAIPDRKPIVRIVEPVLTTEEVSPMAEIPILVRVEDDYPVRGVVIEGTFLGAEAREPVPQRITLLDAGDDPRGAEREPRLEPYVLRIPDLKTRTGRPPAPGDRFEYFALAEDFGETGVTTEGRDGAPRPRGNIGMSQVHLFQVVDPDYLEGEYTRQTLAFRDMASRLEGRQESVRKDLEATQEEFLLKGTMTSADAHRLSRHRHEQHKVSDGIQSLARDMGRLLARMEANKVGEADWKEWLRGLQGELEALAARESEAVVENLDALRRSLEKAPRDPSELASLALAQRGIERELNSLVVRMTEFGDLRGLIQLMRDVIRQQEELRDMTRSGVGPPGSGELAE